MKVNVIVPVFNTEISKLQRCFDSICVAQNKSIANLEIECLIIDDGSEEKYTSWCSEYVKYHNNFKLYKKKNGGVSSARNYGIAKADGDYICFVDSDDVITANTFREIPFDQNFDLIMTDLEFVDGNNKEVWSVLPNIKGKLQVEQIVWRLTQDGKVNGPYCKFIKNKFLKENRIEFKTCVVLGEDLL
ncbi:glycosyltransferase, partial [Limosilactobacillus mucosae]